MLLYFQIKHLGKEIKIHTSEYGVPELDKVNIAIIGVRENRNDINFLGEDLYFDTIRKSLYDLFPGNWDTSIVDLGDIIPGEEVSDTYFLMKDVLSTLLQKNITPLIIGGSQDLVYGQYRAFDILERMVNLVNVDSRFDLGNTSQPIKNNSSLVKLL